MLLGLGLIFANYWLVYSARSRWADDMPMCTASWCRYNLGPQLGLAFFFCGGLAGRYAASRRASRHSDQLKRIRWPPRRRKSLFDVGFQPLEHLNLIAMRASPGGADGALSRRQVAGLAALIVLFFLIQAPRGISGAYYAWPEPWSLPTIPFPQQQEWLRYVERIDACCRKQRISADAARRALPPLHDIQGSFGEINDFNGWDFLWGSDDPVQRSDAETYQLLMRCD